ncbi:hypothetical protein KPL70_020766 [Citrus sinensis]|nr:hypothetical protein KPL70_020766 [Citrus sinensis]
MAATAAAATGGAPKLSHASSNSNRRRLDPSKKLTGSIKFLIKTPNHSSTSSIQRQFTTQASKDPQTEEQEESSIDDNAEDASTFECDPLIVNKEASKENLREYSRFQLRLPEGYPLIGVLLWSKQEDLSYLWKIGVGSFVGAAVIKYGSILFPEITRPNISLALVMISTPVVLAVWLLIKQSSSVKWKD